MSAVNRFVATKLLAARQQTKKATTTPLREHANAQMVSLILAMIREARGRRLV